MNTSSQKPAQLRRENLYLVIWTVIFGTALALGGSVLEPVAVPYISITLASPYVALMITLNKLVVFRRFSVTLMYCITAAIAVFTTYLGPPSILKPIFILAGLSFDFGTLFRTEKLKFWNIIIGHLLITVFGFLFFGINFYVMVPKSIDAVIPVLIVAAPFHFGVSVLVAAIVYKFIPPNDPPDIVKAIRSQLGHRH